MPALMTYQIVDCAHASDQTTDRGAIEHIALACLQLGSADCLNATVIETRYNVVRSNIPHAVSSVRKLRDYLPSAHVARLGATNTAPAPSPRVGVADADLVVGPS